jgi:hypothetical protein
MVKNHLFKWKILSSIFKKKKTPSSSLDGYFECSSLDDHLGKPFSEEGGS